MIWKAILVAGEAYLLGSVPFGYLLYRVQQGGDVCSTGSGNIGATNVLRGAGTAAGVATLLLDAAKGYIAVALAEFFSGHSPGWTSLAALAAICGHIYPVFLKFHGGKGVATGLGAFLALAPFAALWGVAVFAVVALVWRYVSLASITAVLAFPIALLVSGRESSPFIFAASLLGALLIISRHSSNIHRLLKGTERRIRGNGAFAEGSAVER